MDSADLTRRFTYHAPKDGQPVVYQDLRNFARQFAERINLEVPEGREKALAITKLEEVVFWANAGIARAP